MSQHNGAVLVSFAHAAPAETLIGYLLSQGIDSQIVKDIESARFQVVIHSSEDFESAVRIAKDFTNNPNAEKYNRFAWNTSAAAIPLSGGFSFTELFTNLVKTPFVSLILLVCLFIYFSWQGLGQFTLYEVMFMQPFTALQESVQWWRLVTPAFLHFSAMHIAFNLLWWWWLGSQVEQKLGSFRLLAFLVLVAIASNVAQTLVSGLEFGGMSGVVYGLTGFVWWMQWLKPEAGLKIPLPLVGFALVWMALGFAEVLWVNMANTAHAVGLISGCLIAFGYARLK